MRKFFAISALALAAAVSLSAKTADELRVYINPGHGSWTSNDRPMTLVGHKEYTQANTDTTNFFESNTNLRKGFGVLEKLIQYGVKFDRTLNQEGERWQIGAARDLSNNIVMSHVKCGPYIPENNNDKTHPQFSAYNRNLSEICAEVEANNFDMFISIHSNAASEGGTANYPLVLYRGNDKDKGGASVEGSYEMAQTVWPHWFANTNQVWSNYSMTNPNIRGDIDFYGSSSTGDLGYVGYLGVLKHGVPGFLVEGYFHTYQPARHRAMNWDVDYLEGYAYARGIADYFGLSKEKTGDIYGIVRDLHEKYTDTYYKPNVNSADLYKPINGAKVTLKKGETTVATYTTDENTNGVYAFRDIDPGTYTVIVEKEGYVPAEPVEVTVKEAETTYPASINIEVEGWEPPKEPAATYADEFNIPAYGPQGTYNFNPVYTNTAVEQLANLKVKKSFVRGEKVYVLAHETTDEATPHLFILNGVDGTVVRELGVAEDLSDIALTADGVLLGINKGIQAFGGANKVKIYKWAANADDNLADGAPEVLETLGVAGNWTNGEFGHSMAFAGTLEEGSLIYSAVTTASSRNLRVQRVFFNNGVVASSIHMNQNQNSGDTHKNEVDLGDYALHISPATDNNFIITSELLPPAEFTMVTKAAGKPDHVATMDAALKPAGKVQIFKYAGSSVMAVPAVAEGKNVGVTLLDITDGLANAKAVKTVKTELAAGELASSVAMGQTVVERDAMDVVTSGWMNLYALRADGISHFTTKAVDQPLNRAAYAYDLKMDGDDKTEYTLSFNASSDAENAEIVLTPVAVAAAEGDAEEIVIPVGAVKAGLNTVKVDPKDYEETQTFNWAVRLTSEAQGSAGKIFSQETARKTNARGGVQFINDPESQNFGKIIVSNGYAGGIDVYSPDLSLVGTYFKGDARFDASNAASSFRMGQRDGIAYIVDWSDKGAGYWMFDASNPAELNNFLEGEKNAAGGYVVDGNVIGGGATCVAFQGKGENCRMYTFVEDFTPGNIFLRYDIGAAKTWGKMPDKQFPEIAGNRYFANTNVEAFAMENGLFIAQVRGSGNNVKGCPGFVYMNNEGEILLNSADLEDLTSTGSGIAVNNEGNILAVALGGSGISIWDLVWDGETPVPTFQYVIPNSGTAGEVNQLSFDAAGNLYAYHRQGCGFAAYALCNENPVSTVAAPEALVIRGSAAGVEDVTVDAEDPNAPVEYYNLNGIKVNGDNLIPGIYIKRQGKKVEKILVR